MLLATPLVASLNVVKAACRSLLHHERRWGDPESFPEGVKIGKIGDIFHPTEAAGKDHPITLSQMDVIQVIDKYILR